MAASGKASREDKSDGDPRAEPIRRENTCGVRGTSSDNLFRFAAATLKTVGSARSSLEQVDKSRRQHSYVAQSGRVMSIIVV